MALSHHRSRWPWWVESNQIPSFCSPLVNQWGCFVDTHSNFVVGREFHLSIFLSAHQKKALYICSCLIFFFVSNCPPEFYCTYADDVKCVLVFRKLWLICTPTSPLPLKCYVQCGDTDGRSKSSSNDVNSNAMWCLFWCFFLTYANSGEVLGCFWRRHFLQSF